MQEFLADEASSGFTAAACVLRERLLPVDKMIGKNLTLISRVTSMWLQSSHSVSEKQVAETLEREKQVKELIETLPEPEPVPKKQLPANHPLAVLCNTPASVPRSIEVHPPSPQRSVDFEESQDPVDILKEFPRSASPIPPREETKSAFESPERSKRLKRNERIFDSREDESSVKSWIKARIFKEDEDSLVAETSDEEEWGTEDVADTDSGPTHIQGSGRVTGTPSEGHPDESRASTHTTSSGNHKSHHSWTEEEDETDKGWIVSPSISPPHAPWTPERGAGTLVACGDCGRQTPGHHDWGCVKKPFVPGPAVQVHHNQLVIDLTAETSDEEQVEVGGKRKREQ